MGMRFIRRGMGKTTEILPWRKFLYEYRVKEYIWERIAEGDALSLKEFDLAVVYCHGCGASGCDCRCRGNCSYNASSNTSDD